MEIVHYLAWFLGIDVGKDLLVVCLLSGCGSTCQTKTFSNDAKGVASLLEWLGDKAKSCRAVMEATSRYHRICERALWGVVASVELVNPRRARALATALGHMDKDDKVDAHALAMGARLLESKGQKLATLAAQELRDHSRTIAQMKEDAANYLKRMEGLDSNSAAYQACKKAARALKALAAQEEREWRKTVKDEPETYRRYKLALSVPDVGHVTARTVAVELPADLSDRSAREISGYAGLVPRRRQSGASEMPPHIEGGNAHLRTGLFMATIHAVYKGKRFEEAYKRLAERPHVLVRTKGGRHLKAIVALMRKLLTNILAVIKQDRKWEEKPPKQNKAVPAVEDLKIQTTKPMLDNT